MSVRNLFYFCSWRPISLQIRSSSTSSSGAELSFYVLVTKRPPRVKEPLVAVGWFDFYVFSVDCVSD